MTGIANANALNNSQTLIAALLGDVFKGTAGGVLRGQIKEVSVNGNFLEIPAVSAPSRLQKRVGPRERSELRAYSQVERVETYDKTVSVDRKRYRHDPSGAIADAIGSLASNIDADIDDLFSRMFMANTWKSYDGVTLLSQTAHPHSDGTGINNVNAALSLGSYKAARNRLTSFRDESGRPYASGEGGLVLVCGAADRQTALEITGAQRPVSMSNAGVTDATANVVGAVTIDNVYRGDAIVVVNKWFTNGAWYLADAESGLSPFLFGVAEALHQDDSDRREYDDDELDFGVRGDLALGAGAWQGIAGYPGA